MPRKYPYYPVTTPGTGKLAGTEKFVDLCKRRWGFTNLGTFVVRNMRGKKTLSVHSLGVAGDIGYPKTRAGRRKAKEAWDWFIEHSEALGLCELHDYAYRDPKQPKTDQTAYGRGWRCSRGEGSRASKSSTKQTTQVHSGGHGCTLNLKWTWQKTQRRSKQHGVPCRNPTQTRLSRL
jgi:hypothetical protein